MHRMYYVRDEISKLKQYMAVIIAMYKRQSYRQPEIYMHRCMHTKATEQERCIHK